MELAIRASGSLCVCVFFVGSCATLTSSENLDQGCSDSDDHCVCVRVLCVCVRAWKRQLEVMMLWKVTFLLYPAYICFTILRVGGAQFTGFTSTKVQILTQRGDQSGTCSRGRAR